MSKWIISVLLFAGISPLFSQKLISLKEAIQTALSNQHGIQISKTDLEIASVQDHWSNTGIMPEVFFNLSPTLSFNSLDQKLVNGTEIRRDNARSEQINANLQLNWNFFKGFQMFVVKDRLEEQVTRSKFELDLAILDMSYQVALTYYDIVRQQNLIRTVEEQLSFAKDRIVFEQNRFDLGLKGKSDLLNAQMDEKDLQITLRQQLQNIKLSKLNLLQLMQWPLEDSIALSDTSFQTVKTNTNLILSNDLTAHPQWSFYQSEQKILQYSKKEIQYERWPGLGLIGAYNFNRTENQAGFNLFSQNYGPLIQLQLSVPIYQGGRIKSQAKEMDLRLKRNEISSEQWSSGAKHQLQVARQNMNYYEELVQLESDRIVHAQKILDLVKERSKRSESTHLELRQSMSDVLQAEISKQDALYQLMVQQLILSSLKGDLGFLLE